MNLDAFNLSILVPALLAGLLVLSTHVPLGMQVLSRGIVFIDLAIAQIATLGVIAADRVGFEPEGWVAQVAAVSAAGPTIASVASLDPGGADAAALIIFSGIFGISSIPEIIPLTMRSGGS